MPNVQSADDEQSAAAASTPDIPAVEFRNVSLSFGEVRALRDVSFALPEGQMTVITGSSGSGKSVLLRLAIGLMRPDRGAVLVRGREIQDLEEEDLLKIRGGQMGLVFQEDALFSGMSTYENAAYRLVEQRQDGAETERMVREILRFVGLEEAMGKLPEQLSGGMKRRLEIARALVGWPSIALIDEPTAGLDPINAHHILDLIIRARDLHRISSLCVTKMLPEILYLSGSAAHQDRTGKVEIRSAEGGKGPGANVILLENGEIAFTGTAEEFARSTLPAALSITRPQRHK
jgi:phospholipid/cholesterol/gamma-HCH transport system ATP-binding protein